MVVTYYLKRPEATSNTSIFARISYKGYQLKYYVSEKINPANWNKNTHRAKGSKNFREYPEFNNRLFHIESAIRNVFRKYQNDNNGEIPLPETLKHLLDIEIKKIQSVKPKEVTLFEYIEKFISRSTEGTRVNSKTKRPTVTNTNKGYTTTLNHLKEFQNIYSKKIDFDTIDIDFYNDYVKFLMHDLKLRFSTIGDHIKRLKTILNEATEKGINKNVAFRSKYFSKLNEETDTIYLNEKELQEIESLDLADNLRLEKVRDLFLISCYTGLRYSDYSVLRADQINGGFIETTQLKTNGAVVIPIHETVERILQKYNGLLPKANSNQKMNDYIKEIGKMLPSLRTTFSQSYTKAGNKVTITNDKWQLMTTHTARRSFATNQYLSGAPILTIMAITGHKTEKSFLRYIKISPSEHAKILKIHWGKTKEMKVI
ncbi:site-specific integrase [Segetibacter koreensis]|uniref:site-specific integrase n=1 Tax=Segetibacter koreensis TaxID=398037 RepID=UPI00037C89DE|nr:site-specific integrase [Segetibacter koreensis]